MVWVFSKDGQQLRCEVTPGRTSGLYRIVVTQSDRTESVEEIEQPGQVIERTVSLMQGLHSEGWQLA